MHFTTNFMRYYLERIGICGSLALVIGKMSQLDGSYSIYLSLSIFAVLMLYSIIVAPPLNQDPRLKALLAWHTAQSRPNLDDGSDGGDGGGD